jgi:hypothetical protein
MVFEGLVEYSFPRPFTTPVSLIPAGIDFAGQRKIVPVDVLGPKQVIVVAINEDGNIQAFFRVRVAVGLRGCATDSVLAEGGNSWLQPIPTTRFVLAQLRAVSGVDGHQPIVLTICWKKL